MSDTQQKNFRLPDISLQQLKALIEKTGMTETQLIILALDRLAQQELPQKPPK